MSFLFRLSIQIYWLVPPAWRRSCLFRKTCSVYVYEVLKEGGFRNGIKALKTRFHQCRPIHGMYTTDDKKDWVILSDHTVVERSDTKL
jgi:putative component of membrane protein insertase Oxa1/YidC/SpoIIIJ protein YidD